MGGRNRKKKKKKRKKKRKKGELTNVRRGLRLTPVEQKNLAVIRAAAWGSGQSRSPHTSPKNPRGSL